jgi:hypothetical protein
VLAAVTAYGQGPDADWRTITTQHFRVHYPAEYEAWAKRAASRIESVRDAVVREVGYEPEQVTDILVMNPLADANGLTLPLLDHPRIVLFAEPPPPESQVGEFSDWIDLLTVHETAHLVHLLRPSRNPMKRLLARALPLNPITLTAPRWVLEGYATVLEGRITGSGRPGSSIRAAILRQWAISGQLPSYSRLDSDQRFMGMSMAYLVGSAYLEWLEQRSGPEALRHLWARMTARQRRSFNQAFEGVFGERPQRLYGRFASELTERAVELTKRETLREGELWQETKRESGDPAVSPDSSKLTLVRRDAHGETKLVVFSTGPNPEEEKLSRRIEEMLKRDPQDVAPVRTKPRSRKPLHTLRPIDGGDIEQPRWTRDGRSILYTHKQPDGEGFLHHDLFLWTPESGVNRRVTHLADTHDADPLLDGQHAIAVRSRYGFSELVTVDLNSGEVAERGERSIERIVGHPRVGADGRVAWEEHDRTGWHVVVDGKPLPVSGAFSPEWGSHGELFAAVASEGFIDIARIDSGLQPITRMSGAAFGPAPAPDGSIYFMSLQPEGFVVRRLAKAEAVASITQTAKAATRTFPEEELPRPRPYDIGRQEVGVTFGGAWTAYGNSNEIGVRVGDVIGRLDALAIASSGSNSAERGAALAATWRGLPVAATAHLFKLRGRGGAEVRGEFTRHAPITLARVEGGALAGSDRRAFVDGSFALRLRRQSATARVAADSAQHARASVRAAARVGSVRLAASGEAARRMSVGGVASSIVPDALLIGRVLDPALPLGFATARRYRGARGDVILSSVDFFWQRHDLETRNVDVRGIELSLRSVPVPLLGLPAFDLTAGAARVSGARGVKGWLALRWRP